MTRKLFLIGIIFFCFLFSIFIKQIFINLKVISLIAQEFPNISYKPLNNIPLPNHQTIKIDSQTEKVIVEQFTPKFLLDKSKTNNLPVIILATGIKLQPIDRKLFLTSAENLSKLGFVVIWPKREAIENGISTIENPETFKITYEYLLKKKNIDKTKISLVGFSTGASIALVAAESAPLKGSLHSFVFFGGYYNIFDYVKSLTNNSIDLNGHIMPWRPAQSAQDYLKEILKSKEMPTILNLIEKKETNGKDWLTHVPRAEINKLKELDPSSRIKSFETPIFIAHDINDKLVPYTESEKLKKAIGNNVKNFTLTDYFDHVTPKKKVKIKLIDLARNYLYFYEVFRQLG